MPEDAPVKIADETAAPIASKAATAQENPFADIIINVLVPVLVLSYLSKEGDELWHVCLLYTSPSPRDRQKSRMPSSA